MIQRVLHILQVLSEIGLFRFTRALVESLKPFDHKSV